MADKIYVGDVGTIIKIDVGTDISAATTTNILVRKKGGDVTWTGSVSSATPTVIDYTIVTDDLDVVGTYYLQPYIVTTSWTGRGETVTMEVYEVFK